MTTVDFYVGLGSRYSYLAASQVDISMAQMGAAKISDLGPHYLMWKDEEDLRRNRR